MDYLKSKKNRERTRNAARGSVIFYLPVTDNCPEPCTAPRYRRLVIRFAI
jgi:hypothetical protein